MGSTGRRLDRPHAHPARDAQGPSVELVAPARRSMDKCAAACAELGIPTAYGSHQRTAGRSGHRRQLHLGHCEWAPEGDGGRQARTLREAAEHSQWTRSTVLQETRYCTGKHIEEGAFVFRNHPQWAKLRNRSTRAPSVRSSRRMQATMAMQFHDPNDIRNNADLGGGALYHMGGYVLSACSMVLGRLPQRVLATIDRDPAMGIDRLLSALLDYGDAHASITVSTQAGPPAGFPSAAVDPRLDGLAADGLPARPCADDRMSLLYRRRFQLAVSNHYHRVRTG